ncbi:hypothetical protein C4E22_07545, partial [ANME-1 cluster archaeon AG-394-G06]|nr:hypothetical protein [ANME-1 cluster archaeon AG-394-G06]
YEYNHNNNLVKVTDALGNETKYEYNAEGSLTNTIDANGHQTKVSSNTLGDYDGIEDAAGNEISFKYDKNGNPIKISNEKGNSSKIAYDALNRQISVTDALGNTKYFEYDALSNLISVTDANGNVTRYTYDAVNQLVRTTDAFGHTTSFSYDANGNPLSITDANGHSTEYVYDALDRKIKTEDAIGNKKTYSYDANGNLLSYTDANGHSRRFEYDTLNRPIAVISPLGYRTQYEYDAVRNLITKIDANGNTTNYSYNELDRLISTSYPDGGKVTREYDAVENLIKISGIGIGLNDVTEFSYNELNKLASATQNYGSFSKTIKYTCDASGNRETVEYPDGGISTSVYDGMDRLTKLTNPAGEVTSYQYDKAGRRIGILYPNRVTATYSYDATGRILSLVNEKSSGDIISSYTYTYDKVGNRLTKTEADKAATKYEYDALYQLTNVTYPSGDITRYTYDAAGNRLSEENGNSTISYIYDADDRLVTANGTSYYYDNNGNLIREIDVNGTTLYEYDYEKRLTGVTLPDASEVSYHYSPLGGRLAKTDRDGTTTYYLYDFEHLFHKPEDILMELDVGGAQKAIYTHGPGVDEPISQSRDGVTSYYLFDALGSVTSLTDIYENVVASYQYDAFGKILEQTGTVENPYKFTSREHDEGSGLYYYRARYYDATVGRFLTKDPLAITLAVNLYGYVDNNPVNMADPSGHGFWSDYWGALQHLYVNPVVNAATWVENTAVATGRGVATWVYDQWNWWSAFGSEFANHLMDYWTIIWSEDYRYETALPILAITAGVMLIVAMPQILCAFPEALSATGGWIVGTAIPTTMFYGMQAMLYIPVVGTLFADLFGAMFAEPTPNIVTALWLLFTEILPGTGIYGLFESNGGPNTVSIAGSGIVGSPIPPDPGNDHQDDNYDVSILSDSQDMGGDIYKSGSDIAVLSRGFYSDFANLLAELGESSTSVDVAIPIEELKSYHVFIIPGGGLFGLDALSSFKTKLEQYVSNGGTLIVFSQQHGYEFDAAPG